MKQKIAIAIAALSLMTMLSACNMGGGEETSSINESRNDISSVVSGNIPNGNTDGEYDNTSGTNSNGSNTLQEDISSMISSGNNAVNSMMDK